VVHAVYVIIKQVRLCTCVSVGRAHAAAVSQRLNCAACPAVTTPVKTLVRTGPWQRLVTRAAALGHIIIRELKPPTGLDSAGSQHSKHGG
jgi:hypothetical protein